MKPVNGDARVVSDGDVESQELKGRSDAAVAVLLWHRTFKLRSRGARVQTSSDRSTKVVGFESSCCERAADWASHLR